jgi:hypothetical protein
MYTELAINIMKLIQDSYPELAGFYNPQMGNFNFTKEEFKENIESILGWLKEQDDYLVMYQEGEYWLTDFKD